METLSPNASLAWTNPALAFLSSTLMAARIAVLEELESSLRASVRALMSRDLAVLERTTRDQLRLRQGLEVLWTGDCDRGRAPFPAILPDSPGDPKAAEDLRAAQSRVLHLGRVQAALLRREQRWLNVLAHLVAGPEANYVGHSPNSAANVVGLR